MTTQELEVVEKGWNGVQGPDSNIQHRMTGDENWEHCPYPRFYAVEFLEFRVDPKKVTVLDDARLGLRKVILEDDALAAENHMRTTIQLAYNGLENENSNIEFKFDNEPDDAWTTVTPQWNWIWCNYRIKQ